MNNKRDYSLDIARIAAMFLIVLMHSPMPGSANGAVLAGISYVTAPGIGLFFMVSGALLLKSELRQEVFLKRRFSKILWPTLFWTIFYICVNLITSTPPSSINIYKILLSIPFSAQGHGVLWFMYTLAGLYLLTPILRKWLKESSKREIEFYLLLWVITLCYPYLSLIGLDVNESTSGILYYFSGYVGYFILGFYLKEKYEFRWWHTIIAGFIGTIIPIVVLASHTSFDFYKVLWYLSLPVACLSIVYWQLLTIINLKERI